LRTPPRWEKNATLFGRTTSPFCTGFQHQSREVHLPRRPRRLRTTPAVRNMVQETILTTADLIMPLFVIDGQGAKQNIESMPGQYRYNIKDLIDECKKIADLKIPAVALFPCVEPSLKDPNGSYALAGDSLVLRAVKAIKSTVPDLTVITDIALDPYTSHGHDGLLNTNQDDVDNDKTLNVLSKMAVINAEAGVNFVAPSDMMDGRVGVIRSALDTAGFHNTGIIAYSVKFNSAYYGPFREAVGSAKAAGTRLLSKATYQMNPANRNEANIEALLDEQEGADVIMVKPAGAYLDIIREVRNATKLPVAAYQVSGEYSQLIAASRHGWLDLERTRDEALLSIKRAGADMIFTYFARDIAPKLLKI